MAAAQLIRFNLRMNKYVMWLALASVVAFFKGDLLAVFVNTVAPLVNQAAATATGSQQPILTPEMMSFLATPSTDIVPAWIYTDTYQIGTGLGDLFAKL